MDGNADRSGITWLYRGGRRRYLEPAEGSVASGGFPDYYRNSYSDASLIVDNPTEGDPIPYPPLLAPGYSALLGDNPDREALPHCHSDGDRPADDTAKCCPSDCHHTPRHTWADIDHTARHPGGRTCAGNILVFALVAGVLTWLSWWYL